MEGDKQQTTVTCTVVAMDHNNIMYRICSTCERTLPDPVTNSNNNNNNNKNNTCVLCKHCNFNNAFTHHSSSKRLFRLLMSIATDTKVFVVIMFDRAASVLFGCSADDFFEFSKTHPFAAEDAAKVLEGEMLKVTLSKPKNGNAQHQRVVSILPLRSGFRSATEELKELYKVSNRS